MNRQTFCNENIIRLRLMFTLYILCRCVYTYEKDVDTGIVYTYDQFRRGMILMHVQTCHTGLRVIIAVIHYWSWSAEPYQGRYNPNPGPEFLSTSIWLINPEFSLIVAGYIRRFYDLRPLQCVIPTIKIFTFHTIYNPSLNVGFKSLFFFFQVT